MRVERSITERLYVLTEKGRRRRPECFVEGEGE